MPAKNETARKRKTGGPVTVWIPAGHLRLIDDVRRDLGLSRSGFIVSAAVQAALVRSPAGLTTK